MPSYEAVAPVAPGRVSQRTGAVRVVAAASALLLCCAAVAVVVGGGQERTVLQYGAHLRTENPAVRGSDPIENNPASAFMGGPITLKEMPPQCERITSGDSQCQGPAFDCAQCMEGNGFCRPAGGSIHLTKVDGVGKFKDYYFLTAVSSLGHPIMAAMRSTDGYSREWNQIGTIWTGESFVGGWVLDGWVL